MQCINIDFVPSASTEYQFVMLSGTTVKSSKDTEVKNLVDLSMAPHVAYIINLPTKFV